MFSIFLLYLAVHKVFGFGTVKRIKIGLSGAFKIWKLKKFISGIKETFVSIAQRKPEGNLFVFDVYVFGKDV